MQALHNSNISSIGTTPVTAEQNFTRHSPPNSPPHGRGTGGNNSPTYGNNGSNDNRYKWNLKHWSSQYDFKLTETSR